MATEGRRNHKDYNNGKIYCIRNTVDEDIYLGSTCQTLSKRMAKHRTRVKASKYHNINLYAKMCEVGLENCYIELVEDFPCDGVEQLNRREGQLARDMTASLNMRVAGRTNKEYHADNTDRIKTHRSAYFTCECGKQCRIGNKARHNKSKYHQDKVKHI